MLDYLTRLKRSPKAPRRAGCRVPADVRVYAIGDIHGCSDLLDALLDRIRADRPDDRRKRRVLVFLGDYIDRGPDSAGVIERLSALRAATDEAYFLLGNHEEALLRAIGGEPHVLADWLRFGGRACLRSYGVEPESLEGLTGEAAARLVAEAIPAHHRAFLEACDDSIRIGDYLFVHAGIRPGLPLSQQEQRDLRWIRAPFLNSGDDHGMIVVHGHTISPSVDWQVNRIGIDTGAYDSGILTALVLSGDRRRLIQTAPTSDPA